MKHAMRKYLSSSGSALFMVVGTMSALIMLVTAMYLSVLSSRSVQLTVFNQDQAYVSSTAISDIVRAYITDGSSDLASKVLDKDFKSISTNGNGFAELTGNIDDADSTIYGAYDVTITRLEDEGSYKIFDVAVTVANNGIYETTHSLMAVDTTEKVVPDMNETFAATGYIPNDVWIDSGTYRGTMYFDSEYTRLGTIKDTGGGLTMLAEVRCAGSASINHASINAIAMKEPTRWVIGNNFYMGRHQSTFDLGGNNAKNKHGELFVGGDFMMDKEPYGLSSTWTTIGKNGGDTDVYVMGDAYLNNFTNYYGDLYVGGNLYFLGSVSGVNGDLHLADDSKVYYMDELGNYHDIDKEPVTKFPKGTYDASYCAIWNGVSYDTAEKVNTFRTNVVNTWTDDQIKAAKEIINNELMACTFMVWDVDTTKADAKVVNIDFDTTGAATANPTVVINEDCTIGDITNTGNTHSATIVFDTGKDPKNQLTIKLGKNNYDSDGDGVADCFSWSGGTKLNSTQTHPVNVVVVGCGNLVIDIPSNVNYQASDQEFFGHYGWYIKLGGKVIDGTRTVFNRDGLDTNLSTADVDVLRAYVHKTCNTCTYKRTDKGDGTFYYTCTTHGGQWETTKKEFKDRTEDNIILTECLCHNRLQSPPSVACKIKATKAGTTDVITVEYTAAQNKTNVNTFLVSSTESSTISFCKGKSLSVKQNTYFGYIYAPYMTYMDTKDVGGDEGMKIFGGLIVSDYILAGTHEYVQCYPDRSLKDIMGNQAAGDGTKVNKTWRVYGV